MAGFKLGRVTSDIKITLSELLREVKDPRVSKLLSIVKVDAENGLVLVKGSVPGCEGRLVTIVPSRTKWN